MSDFIYGKVKTDTNISSTNIKIDIHIFLVTIISAYTGLSSKFIQRTYSFVCSEKGFRI
jgi:hypothetical protein